MEVNNSGKLAALKKQIREIQNERIKIETFDKKTKKSTQRWNIELKKARKLVKPGEVLAVTDNVRVRIETAEAKLSEFTEKQKLLKDNYKEMTRTVYDMFKEIESEIPLDEKVKIERQLKYCINF